MVFLQNKKNFALCIQALVIGLFLSVFFVPMCAVAATNDFPIQALIGLDSVPPSTPTGLVATGVAISQVDLSWASSTDNYLLSGYHVWRDDVLIATTSLTTYSDTGLSSSTSYVYYVTAFDSAFNESASSTSATGTTLALPPPPPLSDGPIYGTRMTPLDEQIEWFEILPRQTSVVIRFTTDDHVRSIVKWGRGISYELGSLAERTFSREHEITITGLSPGTKYEFVMEGENKIGRYGSMYQGTFMTLPPNDTYPPSNVSNLTAIKRGDGIVLSWVNPSDADFSKVRVVRNETFYPSDTADGWVAYEGDGEGFVDEGVAVGEYQFYTVFSYDALGNISSGAVVSVYVGTGTEVTPPIVIDETKNNIELLLSDIEFIQDGVTLPIQDGAVSVNGAKQLTISIPYERVPEHLKTVLVTVEEGNNSERVFRFLLRVNNERTAYRGTLAPFGVSMVYPFSITVFDYATSQIGFVKGKIASSINSVHEERTIESTAGTFIEYLISSRTVYILFFLFSLIALSIVGRRLIRSQF